MNIKYMLMRKNLLHLLKNLMMGILKAVNHFMGNKVILGYKNYNRSMVQQHYRLNHQLNLI